MVEKQDRSVVGTVMVPEAAKHSNSSKFSVWVLLPPMIRLVSEFYMLELNPRNIHIKERILWVNTALEKVCSSAQCRHSRKAHTGC